ncbi:MAG: rod shape-determining protein [Clostridiales bacterium]|nr:rod shape-determining protein [Clostridiales bacterium]
MFGLTKGIGIDLGTATTLVYLKGKGIVMSEPAVIAVDKNSKEVVAIGEDAQKMLGRTPGHILAIRPLRDGVISDYEMTELMLRKYLQSIKRHGLNFLYRFNVVVCVPSGVTQVEKRAVIEAISSTGARRIELIEEPVAAAIGAGLDVSQPYGNMVVDIGGGTTDIAVISLGGPVTSASIKVAGDKFDEAIIKFIRKKYNMQIGERTAEQVKILIGEAFKGNERRETEVTGRDLVSGLPMTITVGSDEIREALEEPITLISDAVRDVLERTPPELAVDIGEAGIIMTGGGSLLHGLDQHIAEITHLPVKIAENAVECVALGTGKVLEMISQYEDSLFDGSSY